MANPYGLGSLGQLGARREGGARGALQGLERDAHQLADRMPDLLLEADRIASTVAHGIHGRRRAGPGETFWQFRQLQPTDSVQMIDWRRSASSDTYFVREREWEASHTLWLWPDLSPSMAFKSHLSRTTKRDRALVLMLASAELLVRSGERVAYLGLTQPTASRRAAHRIAESLIANADQAMLTASRPPSTRLSRFSSVILFSDFLDSPDDIRSMLQDLASKGVAGHLVQVFDPAEETLPYEGRTEFVGPEGGERWIADRAESLRPAYQAKLKAHREAIAEIATRLGWSFLVHHTDRPASEILMALTMHLEGHDGGYRHSAPVETPSDMEAGS